jgi:hypothetical protein
MGVQLRRSEIFVEKDIPPETKAPEERNFRKTSVEKYLEISLKHPIRIKLDTSIKYLTNN